MSDQEQPKKHSIQDQFADFVIDREFKDEVLADDPDLFDEVDFFDDPEEALALDSSDLEDSETDDSSSVVFDDEPAFEEELSITARVEALVFASPQPIPSKDIFQQINAYDESVTQADVDAALHKLVVEYRERGGGFRIRNLPKRGYQFQTVKAASSLMESLFSSRPRPLSRAALETLAIVAYRQPVTRMDVEFIRGVDSGSIIKNLIERDLIRCVGRKEEAGRPMIFGTTDEFLQVFGLNSLSDLPSLMSFQPSSEVIQAANRKLEDHNKSIELGDIVPPEGDGDFEGLMPLDELDEEESQAEGSSPGDGAFKSPHHVVKDVGVSSDVSPLLETSDDGPDSPDLGDRQGATIEDLSVKDEAIDFDFSEKHESSALDPWDETQGEELPDGDGDGHSRN